MGFQAIFLPGKFHGQRSLADYSPWGRKESDTTEQLSTHNIWTTIMNSISTKTQKLSSGASFFLSFFLFFFFFLLFLFIYFLAVLRGIWDLSPQAGIEPVSPALEVKSLNCWTTRSSKGLFLMSIAENNRGAEGSPMRK